MQQQNSRDLHIVKHQDARDWQLYATSEHHRSTDFATPGHKMIQGDTTKKKKEEESGKFYSSASHRQG